MFEGLGLQNVFVWRWLHPEKLVRPTSLHVGLILGCQEPGIGFPVVYIEQLVVRTTAVAGDLCNSAAKHS